MTEALIEYGLFFAKTVTLAAAILFVAAALVNLQRRARESEGMKVTDLKKRLRQAADGLRGALLPKAERKKLAKQRKQEAKAEQDQPRKRVFVLDFRGDIRASATASLREEVNAVLAVAEEGDQVLVRLENAGGLVHEHGLAASQLVRLREAGVKLTVAVDRVAASGGYLMACIADRIVAAPFAILGSIGVLAQLPNFNRMLDNHGVEFEQISAGKYKRTVTMFGKNTEEDRDKLRQELEDVHQLFQDAVGRYRPDLDMQKVATGEHWYGTRAIELSLADELATSDELLIKAVDDRDVYKVTYEVKQPLPKKVLHSMDAIAERAADILWRRLQESRYLR